MAKNKDSFQNVVIVALSLCLVAAIGVSSIAVGLKPQREANKELDRAKNILLAAGLFEQGKTANSEIDSLFEQVEIRLVDLREGKLLTASEAEAIGIDPVTYDQRSAAKDPAQSRGLETAEDIASISRQADYGVVYLLRAEGKVDKVVIPVHGYGLWSIMYGYIALQSDMTTVSGITFYEHGETAGLGGEVDNPVWKTGWEDKEIFGADGDVALTVVKGAVDPANANAMYQIDGLSGATLTSRGVQNMIEFWLGDSGFGPILKELKG